MHVQHVQYPPLAGTGPWCAMTRASCPSRTTVRTWREPADYQECDVAADRALSEDLGGKREDKRGGEGPMPRTQQALAEHTAAKGSLAGCYAGEWLALRRRSTQRGSGAPSYSSALRADS